MGEVNMAIVDAEEGGVSPQGKEGAGQQLRQLATQWAGSQVS